VYVHEDEDEAMAVGSSIAGLMGQGWARGLAIEGRGELGVGDAAKKRE
jgi:hypothetical protein